MFTGKEILIAVAAVVVTIGIVWYIIKWLISAALDYLRETLIELKNNDIKLFDKHGNIEKCNAGMKKDIEHNTNDINTLFSELRKCKDKHNV